MKILKIRLRFRLKGGKKKSARVPRCWYSFNYRLWVSVCKTFLYSPLLSIFPILSIFWNKKTFASYRSIGLIGLEQVYPNYISRTPVEIYETIVVSYISPFVLSYNPNYTTRLNSPCIIGICLFSKQLISPPTNFEIAKKFANSKKLSQKKNRKAIEKPLAKINTKGFCDFELVCMGAARNSTY